MARRGAPTKLIGRDDETRAIDAVLSDLENDARGAPGRCLVISGEAGVGKSRLVAIISDSASRRGLSVGVGRCVENGALIAPLAPILEMLENLAHADVSGGRNDDDVTPSRLFQVVLHALTDVAADHPAVAVIEDLHWADPTTLAIVPALAERVSNVLWVVTVRTDDLASDGNRLPALARLERMHGCEHVHLSPLTREQTAALAVEIRGQRPSEPDIDRLFALGGGNPFFTAELLVEGRTASQVPESLRLMALARRQSVGDEAASALDAAAILASPINDAVLKETAGLSIDEYDHALDRLAEARFLDGYADKRHFRHELMREVLREELPPGSRRRLHRRAADALAVHQPYRVGEIARHRWESGDMMRALGALVTAAEAALRTGAAVEASDHLERALSNWDHVPDPVDATGLSRGATLRMAASAAIRSRRIDRAVELGRMAAAELERTDPGLAAHAWYELSVYAWTAGADDVVTALDRARQLTPQEPPSVLSANIDHDRAYQATMHGNDTLADALSATALDSAQRAGSPSTIAVVRSGIAERRAERGDGSGLDDLRAAIDAAESGPTDLNLAKAVVNLTYCLATLGRDEQVPPLYEKWIGRLVDTGLGAQAGVVLEMNALDAYESMGAWDQVQDLVEALFIRYDEESLRRTSSGLVTNWGQVLIGRGDYEPAADLFLRGRDEFRGSHYKGCWGGLLTGLVELGARDVVDGPSDAEISTILAHALPGDAIDAARAAATICRFRTHETAAQWLGTVESAVATKWIATPPVVVTWLDQARAELASAAATSPSPSWDAIATRWRDLRRPYPAAYAAYRAAGERLRMGTGRSRAARQAVAGSLRQAYQAADALGAAPLRSAIERLAKQARLDVSPPEPVPPRPPFHLSPREYDVLRLLADGRTDKEIAGALFITRKTASQHVSSILRKTKTTNRYQAAALLDPDHPTPAP